MARVLHLSDVHVPPRGGRIPLLAPGWRRLIAQPELRVFRRAARFSAAAGTLRGLVARGAREGVDHVVVSGDLTTLSLDGEFAEARRSLGVIADDPARLSVIPGNHDRYTRESVARKRFEAYFGQLLCSALPEHQVHGAFPFVHLVNDDLAVVGLDTTQLAPLPGLVYGRVGAAQRAALTQILQHEKVTGRSVLVALHHGPYRRNGQADFWNHGLRDARAVLDVCAEYEVAAMLHGHIHDRYRRTCPRSGVEVFGGGSSTEAGRTGGWLLEVSGGRVTDAQEIDTA